MGFSLGVKDTQQGAIVSGSVWDRVRERQGRGPGKQTPTRIFCTCKSEGSEGSEGSEAVRAVRDNVRERAVRAVRAVRDNVRDDDV